MDETLYRRRKKKEIRRTLQGNMISKEKKDEVKKLFYDGTGVSEIAREVGISKYSVYRIVQSDIEHDFEQDAEIQNLKKELRKAELNKKIWEVKKPMSEESELAIKEGNELDTIKKAVKALDRSLKGLDKAVDGLVSNMMVLWYLNPKLVKKPPLCAYCDDRMRYAEWEEKEGIIPGYRCDRCGKDYPLPP